MLSARKADVTVCESTLSAQAGVMQRPTWRARQNRHPCIWRRPDHTCLIHACSAIATLRWYVQQGMQSLLAGCVHTWLAFEGMTICAHAQKITFDPAPGACLVT